MIRVLIARNDGYPGVEVRVLLSAQHDLEDVDTLPLDHALAARAGSLRAENRERTAIAASQNAPHLG